MDEKYVVRVIYYLYGGYYGEFDTLTEAESEYNKLIKESKNNAFQEIKLIQIIWGDTILLEKRVTYNAHLNALADNNDFIQL